jgi:hypothetical protein
MPLVIPVAEVEARYVEPGAHQFAQLFDIVARRAERTNYLHFSQIKNLPAAKNRGVL